MTKLKLHESVFPFNCDNPECKKKYDLKLFTEVVLLWGFIYLTSEDEECSIIGITCPECTKTTIKKYPADVALLCHSKIKRQKFCNSRLNQYVHFSFGLLKEWKVINHSYTQETGDVPIYTVPEEMTQLMYVYGPHLALTENDIKNLCDIENNHQFKAIPRVFASIPIYYTLDLVFQDKTYHDLNETLVTSLIKPNSDQYGDGPSTKFKHMIINDLTEDEYNQMDLDLLADQRKNFIDNIQDFIKEARVIRNKINCEVIYRNQLINKYARKMYYDPGAVSVKKAELLDGLEYEYLPDSTEKNIITTNLEINSSYPPPSVGENLHNQKFSFLEELNQKKFRNLENVFSKEGDIWCIKFNGKITTIKHKKRIYYLVHILNKPEEKLNNLKLQRMVNQSCGHISKTKEVSSENESSNDDNLEITCGLGNDFEKHDILKIQIKIKDKANKLLQKQAEAEKNNDNERIKELNSEIDHWMNTCKGYGANPRIKKNKKGLKQFYPNLIKISKDEEKARKNVGNNITNALKDLTKELPELYRYLSKCIYRDLLCTGFIPHKSSTNKAIKWEIFF